MPYLDEKRKKELDENPYRASTPGDLNYLFTVEYLNIWIKTQRYMTIHLLKKSVKDPSCIYDIEQLSKKLSPQYSADLETARELAFLEFYRRIGAEYEDMCITKNGDLKEYQEAQELMDKKFNQGE